MPAKLPDAPPEQVSISGLAPHPRLWISGTGRRGMPTAETLRGRVQHPEMARWWSAIEEAGGIEYRALVALLTRDETAREEALALVRQEGHPHQLTALAFAYDWLYHDLAAESRRRFAKVLLLSAEATANHELASISDFLHNYPNSYTSAVCLAALAAADEFPGRAQELFDWGWSYQRETALCTGDRDPEADPLNPIYPLSGGGWPEGHDYDRHGTLGALTLWLALRSAGGPDFVSESRFVDQKILWYLQGLMPSGNYALPVGDNDFPGNLPFWHDLLVLAMSAAAEGPHAPYLRSYLWEAVPQQGSAIASLFFLDPEAERRDWRGLPTDHFAAGVGTAAWRSSWEPDASYVAVQASDHYVYHQQNQDGAFYMYRKAPLAWRSGVYDGHIHDHNGNYVIRTIAANCVTVHDPEEQFKVVGAPAANDGGQVVGNWLRKPASFEDMQQMRQDPEAHVDRVTWLAYGSTPDYGYGAFEYGRAYREGKVSEATRQIVFMKPDWVFVLDRVTSGDPDFMKTFVLHAPEYMEVDPEARLTAVLTEEAPGMVAPGRLFCRTLLPEGARLARVGGPGEEFVVDGVNRPHQGGVRMQIPGVYRLEVTAPAGEATTIFLHAFYLCPNVAVTEMPEVRLIHDDPEHVAVSVDVGRYLLRFATEGAADWEWVRGTDVRGVDL